MARKAHPCKKGLTPECFKRYPEFAKRVFAYRILGLLTGLEYQKRLQKMKGMRRIVKREAKWGVPLKKLALPPVFSAIPPLFVSIGQPGPPHRAQEEEEVIIMPAIRKAKINITTAGDHEIIEAVAGKKISIANIALTVGGETNITLKSGTTAISGAMDFGGADEPRGMAHGLGGWPLQTTIGEAFVISSLLEVQVSGYVTYFLAE